MRPYYYLGGCMALTELVDGSPFYVHTLDGAISPWIIRGGAWENFVSDWLPKLVSSGDVCCDIGANIGYYTVILSKLSGKSSKIYSIEPNPELFRILDYNVRINDLSRNVELLQVAASNKNGQAKLYVDNINMGGGFVSVDGDPRYGNDGGRIVQMRPMDDIVPAGSRVDFIKIDTEGFEWAVFSGMSRVIKENPECTIITELNPFHWSKFCDPNIVLQEISKNKVLFWMKEDGHLILCTSSEILSRFDEKKSGYALIITPEKAALGGIA